MKFQASLNNYRRSATKVRELAPAIKGLNVKEAKVQLESIRKGSSEDLGKLLQSAVANAKNSYNVAEEDLVVLSLVANEGRTLKRWRARAYGRAAQIRKRTCHVIITLEAEEDKTKKGQKEVKKSERGIRGNKKEEMGGKGEKGDKSQKEDKRDKEDKDVVSNRPGKDDSKGKFQDKSKEMKGKIFRRKAV